MAVVVAVAVAVAVGVGVVVAVVVAEAVGVVVAVAVAVAVGVGVVVVVAVAVVMSKKPEKLKPVYQSCNVKCSERVWELTDNGWTSRPVTPYDMESRRKLADELKAVMLT